MNGEYRVYDTEQEKYVTNDRLWFIATDGTLYYLKTENAGFVKAKNCVVEWATGITDKNDKKIFELDIVKAKSIATGKGAIYVVGFDESSLCFGFKGHDSGYLLSFDELFQKLGNEIEVEVLGNFHDNRELLIW